MQFRSEGFTEDDVSRTEEDDLANQKADEEEKCVQSFSHIYVYSFASQVNNQLVSFDGDSIDLSLLEELSR